MARRPKITPEVTDEEEDLNPAVKPLSMAEQTALEIQAGQQALRRRSEQLVNEMSVAATGEVSPPITLPQREPTQIDIEDFIGKN